MNESIYATPEADVTAPATDEPRYYVVSPTKFMLLSVLTLTLYFVYWFYRNWKLIAQRDPSSIMPFWRAFFSPIWTFALGAAIAIGVAALVHRAAELRAERHAATEPEP